MVSFGAKLTAVFEARGHLCLGIDPHPFLLERWGLSNSGEGAQEFGLRVVDAAASAIGIVKPQVAFFERHGAKGYAALEHVISAARSAGLLVIADAKRGDVGSTVEAYGQAWLTPGAPLESDALTVSAFQGVGSIAAPAALAMASGKGLFVLAATSNSESIAPQSAILMSGPSTGLSVAASIALDVSELNRSADGALGSIGLVLGATVALDDYGIEQAVLEKSPILAPGFGAQGARFSELRSIYREASDNVVVNVSREILSAGPTGLPAELTRQVGLLEEEFRQ